MNTRKLYSCCEKLSYEMAVDCLISAFPEICVTDADSIMDLPYPVYETYFVPHIKTMINHGNDAELVRIFDYLEAMAVSSDEEVQNLLQVAVLESFWDDSALYRKALAYMHSATKEINRRIEKYLNIP